MEENLPILDFSEMNIHCNRENFYDCEKVGIGASQVVEKADYQGGA